MQKKWFVWTSAFSFIIYALHVPLINYTHQLILPYIKTVALYRLADYLLLPVLITGISIATGALLRAAMPKVYSVLTGGRGL